MVNEVDYVRLSITNDFMFCRVFSDENLCKKLLEVLLGIIIDEIVYIESQVSMDDKNKSKSVKLDILVKVGDSYYNVEMQNKNEGNLINRAIYYRTMVLSHALAKGSNYEILPPVNVIFICGFDVINAGLTKYTFSSICEENVNLKLNNHGISMYIDYTNYKKEENLSLQNLLKYFNEGKPTDEFTKEIETAVENARLNELWRNEYMRYAIEIENAEVRGEVRGEARGEVIKALKMAKKMLERDTIEFVADFVELPVEYIQALNDGCSIESIMEEYA